MMWSLRPQELAARLVADDASIDEKQQCASAFRDNVEELMSGASAQQNGVIESLTRVLETVPPQHEANAEHKLRKSILEVINRVPHTEVLKEHVSKLAGALLNVATEDNQENAIVAVKVVLDLLRAFKPPLSEVASPLLHLFTQLYGCWEDTSHHYFEELNHGMDVYDRVTMLNMDMQPSRRSFRVIAECPITVLHLVQLYGSDIHTRIPRLIELMVKTLKFEGSLEIAPYLHQAYKDMKFAQVKTVAFLSHYVKQSMHMMQPHEQEICDGLMNLLKSCPDVVQWRRELLISTRTLLVTDFRKTLDARLNDLKDERAIVGSSRSCYEALRHYGYAVFAELAHQTRNTLKLDQLSWIVHRSCCIISDTERPAGSHSTAARLLLHLVEVIHRQRVGPDGNIVEMSRELLQKILLCFSAKLSFVKRIKKINSEVKLLLQNLFLGLRTVLYSLTTFNRPSGNAPPPISPISCLTEQEIRFAVKMVKGGIEGLKMCLRLKMQGGISELMELFVEALNVLDPKDFVEIVSARIDYVYTALNTQMELHPIVSMLLDKPKVGLHFLTIMAGYMADHKLDVLADPEQEEYRFVLKLFKLLFHTLLKNEIHSLMAVGDLKAILLITTLVRITRVCLDRAKTCVTCQGYLQLLWFFFRYLNRSRLQFPEMVILLPSALDLFLNMLDGPDLGVPRDLLIELSLLLPLELEKKYAVLPKLMKPLLMALRGTDELVLLAIQTMEEWIDRLNPDFLEPAMAALVQEINLALWSHLKPQQQSPLGHRVLQLLGKLGGRNRRFLAEPLQLEWKDNPEHGLRLILVFAPDTKFLVPLDKCISLTSQKLLNRSPSSSAPDPENVLYYRQQGMQFLHVCLIAMMNLPQIRGCFSSLSRLKNAILEAAPLPHGPHCGGRPEQHMQVKSQYLAEKRTMTSLISTALMLCMDPELKEEAIVFAKGICRHFALLFHFTPSGCAAGESRSFLQAAAGDARPSSTVKHLEPELFIDALIEVMSNEETSVTKCGARALSWFLQMLLQINDEKSIPEIDMMDTSEMYAPCGVSDHHRQRNLARECGLPDVVNSVLHRIVNCCFGDNWAVKTGGIYGIEVLIAELPPVFLAKALQQLMRSALHLMQSLPNHGLSLRTLLREQLMKLMHKAVEGHGSMTDSLGMQESQEMTQAIGKLCLTVFLLNVPERVREDCHDCLVYLCQSFRKSIVDVLDPFVTLQSKSLKRSLEECASAAKKYKAHQVITAFASHMEGLSRLLVYCINQSLPSVPHLLEQILLCADFAVVLLCEAPDDAAAMMRSGNGARPERMSVLARMKESALQMLATLSGWDPFLNSMDIPGAKEKLESMVRVFFKMLISPEEKLREICKTGLTRLIQGQRIPQYDIQSLLTPILSRINKYSSLDLNVLQGGAEALRMLSQWFNLTLGEKLLEHLKRWIESDGGMGFQKSWSPADDSKIAAAILELFHLLPDSASSFLETQKSGTDRIGLVVLTIELEERLGHASPVGPVPHILWSPYRSPLTKFLIRYRDDAINYFLAPTRMQNASYVTRFIDIIKSEIGEPLLHEVMKSTRHLVSLLQSNPCGSEGPSSAMDIPSMAMYHALQLIKTIVKLQPEWLPNQHQLFQYLFSLWKGLDMKERATREETMTHGELFESKAIAKCLLNYISVHHHEVEPLVALLTAFESSSKVDFTFIKEYCMDYVPKHYSHQELYSVLLFVLTHLNAHMSQEQSIFVLRFLVIPILQSLIQKDEMRCVISMHLIQAFVNLAKNTDVQRDVCLEVELLDVGRLLTVGAPGICADGFGKGVLKYAWSFLKAENVECKSHAFLLVAHILRTLQLSNKTVLQVFVNLLKSDFAETKRELVQETLDVMVPALAERFVGQTEPGSIPIWMEYAIKHMQAEGHKLNLLMNLWQMIIGHPDLFYAYRSHFLGQMVNTLSRLRRPPINANSENRQMAIDMERVIVDWEVQRIKGCGDDAMMGSVSPPPLAGETFTNMKKMVVAFLAKTAFAVPSDHSKDNTVKYSYGDIMRILSQALDVWPDVEFRLDFVERLIEGSQMQHQSPALILTAGLDLVSLALQYQPIVFLEHGWHYFIVLSQKIIIMHDEDLLDRLCSALKKVFAIEDVNPLLRETLDTQLLVKYLDVNSHVIQQGQVEHEISACLRILEADKNNRIGMVGRFLSSLVRLLERYSREYVIILQNPVSTPTHSAPPPLSGDTDTIPLPSFGTQMHNVCKILHLCGGRLHEIGSSERECFVVSMIQFLTWKGGRVPDRSVFYHVLVIVSNWLKEWIQNGESRAITRRHLLWSMQQICRLDANGLVEPCMKKHFDSLFLSTIYDVCASPGLNADFRRDVFAHVEQTFLCGIRTTTPELRKQFFTLYQGSFGSSLFERLKFILQTQDWEHVSSRFWLKQALDYLLASLRGREPVTFFPNSAQLAPFPTCTADVMHHGPPMGSDDTEMENEPMSPLDRLLSDHMQFIRERSLPLSPCLPLCQAAVCHIGSFLADDLMGPLKEFAHVHSYLAYHLWVLIFPIVWATLDKNSKVSLAKPIISILTKRYHAVQASHRPNVIQGLMEATSLCYPQPKIPPELIKYLGKTYNAWHIAIPLLESHVVIFPEESRCFDTLVELYSLLSETDMMFGLWKKRFLGGYTHDGINLMQYGYWEEALHVFGEAAVHSTEGRSEGVSREVMLWSEEWCRCAKELNQWDELHSWAEASRSVALLADASWRLPDPDWSELRQLLQGAKEQFPDKLQYSMLMIYSAFQDNNANLCNTHISQAIDQCLQRWWQLPEIGVLGQVHLLQRFQQVVEVCESAKALMELGPRGGRYEQSGFMKEILETWRLRSPNVWEPLSVWSDVFIWRHIIYSSIANSISGGSEPNSPSLHHLCIKDKASSINRLANVARKHGALDVCIDIENNMYSDSYMDVQEAFLKIVEQSKAYLLMDDQKLTGLTMLCSTNLDYFPYQGLQAQIFRLQGEYYRALGDPEMANQSFSTSITLNHQFPEAWLSWGAFCDEMYEKKKQDPNASVQLEYAVGCYFQAMQLPSSAARAMIPRCLHLLSFDKTGTVDKVFRETLSGAEVIPSAYWLFYIPQILSVLHRPEGESLKGILPRIIQTHPQALYYFLRVHMLNMREAANVALEKIKRTDVATSSATPSDMTQAGNPQAGSSSGTGREDAALLGARSTIRQNFEHVKEWMDRLKHQLGPLSNTLEIMLREIASNFMAKPEERLMAVVHVLLARCCKVPGPQTMEVPSNLIREIDGVCRACFPDTRASTAVHKDLKEAFVHHLSPMADGFPKTLGELTQRLKKWRNMLSQYLDEQMPTVLQLHRESPALQELNLHGIEMPCQYTKSPDTIADVPVYLEKISSEIRTIRRQGTAFRRIAFYDSEGRKTHFILQNGHTSGQPASSEERMLQLMCLLNRLLNKHHQCRSRFLSFFAPVIVPVWNKVRLVEEDPCFTTYLEALEVNCQSLGKEPDYPVLLFKGKIYNRNDDPAELALQAFKEITEGPDEKIAENIFSLYMYRILPSSNHLWVFRKQFCAQMALSSLMSVMLSIGGRVPGKILFSRSSGKVLQVDFCPLVNAQGYVHQNEEAVPFRLTRNLATFFSPFGVEGVFTTSMVSAAMALTQRHSNLASCLSLFFRDELLAWASRRESRSQYTSSMSQLQPLVEKNVAGAMQNVKEICPDVPKNYMEEGAPRGAINRGVEELIRKATDPENLCTMDPTWHPWY